MRIRKIVRKFLLVGLLQAISSSLWCQIIFIPPTPPPELAFPGGTLLLNAYSLSELDDLGRTWKPDSSYLTSAGTNLAVFTEEFATVDRSLLTDANVPYSVLRTERWKNGDIVYQIPVDNAPYKVFLYFMEFCGACVGPAMGGFGPPGAARIFDVEVEGDRQFAYNQSDAAVGGPSDGVGAILKATELVFDATVVDGVLNIAIIDRGGTNPPENSAIKALKIVRMPSELGTLGGTLHVNAGGGGVLDTLGRFWWPDNAYVATGGTDTVNGGVAVDLSGLEDSHVPPQVFQRLRTRFGVFSYQLPVPNGVYETRLYFSEACKPCVSPGQGGTGCATCTRVFDVQVEGKAVNGFQPADASIPAEDDGNGRVDRATELVFYTSVEDHYLSVEFRYLDSNTLGGDPFVNAFEVTRLDAQVLRTEVPVQIGLQSGKDEKLFLVEPTTRSVLVTASSPRPFASFALHSRWQGIPSPGNHDGGAAADPLETACLSIGGRPRGSALVLLRSQYAGPEKFEVDIRAERKGLALKSMTPNQVASDESGLFSASIEGFGLDPNVAFKLLRPDGSSQILPREVFVTSATRAEVVFNAAGKPLGLYDLLAERTGPSIGHEPQRATLNSAFTLVARQQGAIVSFSLEGLGTYRLNEVSSAILRYRNEGDADATAPLFKVEGPSGVQFRLRGDDTDRGHLMQVLGIDEGNVAGRLSPGMRWHEVHVYFTSSRPGETELKVSLLTPTESDLLPWSTLPAPGGLSGVEWQSLRGKLPQRAGNTWLEYQEALARTATRLHRRGEDASNVGQLFRFLSRQALDRFTEAVTGQMSHEASGEPVKDATIVARVGKVPRSFGRTDLDGFFTIDWLRPGETYEIAISGWSTPAAMVTMPAGGDVSGVRLLARPFANGLVASCSACQESGLPSGPVVPPNEVFAGTRTRLLSELSSFDPNDKRGPRHPENSGMEDTECAGNEVRYEIRFENLASATAAAWDVKILDTIDDAVFDLKTFRFLEVVLPGKSFPLTTVEQSNVLVPSTGVSGTSETVEGVGISNAVCVNVKGSFDPVTGRLECLLEAVDPLTSGPPSSSLLGVVAPGEHGLLSFAVTLDSSGDIDEGTEVKNSGEIIFDTNAPLVTNEFKNRYSRCLPEVPHSPVPDDRVDRGVGVDLALGWASANAETFDVFLAPAGGQLTKRASGLRVQGFRPTGLASNTIYQWQVVARNARGTKSGPLWRFFTGAVTAVRFRRGDSNEDGKEDISDAVFLLKHLFSGGITLSCEKAADMDDSGNLDITDAVRLLGYLFLGSSPLSPPFLTCGKDGTADSLKCPDFTGCP